MLGSAPKANVCGPDSSLTLRESEEWKQRVESLTSIVARHSDEIDKYIAAHGPMTREEVLDRALTKLLTEKP